MASERGDEAMQRRRFAYAVFVAALVAAVGAATMVLAPSDPGAAPTGSPAAVQAASR